MAVVIRLARHGRTHRPFYRVIAIDSREHREGKASEVLGTYDPLKAETNIEVNIERVHAWIRQGAKPSQAVASLLKRGGYEVFPAEVGEAAERNAAKRKAKWAKRKKSDGKTWKAPSRRAVNNHAKGLKQARLAEAAKAAAAKAEADAAAAAAAESEAEATEAEAADS